MIQSQGMKKKSIFLVGMISIVFLQEVSAQSGKTFKGVIPVQKGVDSLGYKIQNGTVTLNDIPLVIIHFIDLATKLAGTIAVIFILYAGFQMMTSGVTESKESAKNTLKWAVVGLTVTFLAWVIVNLIQVQLTA